MHGYVIRDLQNRDKPRERLRKLGASALSDTELLAIVLRAGGRGESAVLLAGRLLVKFGGFEGLASTSLEHLTEIHNIGLAKAIEIKATCEIALRISMGEEISSKIVKNPRDVFNFVRKDFYSKKKEELHLISLDSRQRIIARDVISVGTVNETVVHPREIYNQALLRNAVSIILVHNHPSQDTKPSSEDVVLTEKVAKAGGLLDIPLIDHVVVSNKEYTSLKALGLFRVKNFEGKEVKK